MDIMEDYPMYSSGHSQQEKFWENKSSLTKHRDTYPFIDPFRFTNTLRGKVVVITLAHRGIGSASAKAFAAAGASVAMIGPSPASLQSVQQEIRVKYNTPTLTLTANLLDANTPTRIVQTVEKHLGLIDILINISPPGYLRPFTQENDVMSDWWRCFEASVRAPIAMTHAVLPSMIARGTGTIISTTSLAGVLTVPFFSVDGVSSSAMIKFQQNLDSEVGPKGIQTFAVHPGLVPSHVHDPGNSVVLRPEDYESEPRIRTEVVDTIPSVEWDAAGLATGTFVALCAEPRARYLSGKYVNASTDLGEAIALAERDPGRIEREKLYVLKVEEF